MFLSRKKDREIKKGHDTGFTIVEVLIAISILTVGMLATASMQISAIRGNDLSGSTTEAVNLAQQQLETIINMNYNNPAIADSQTGNNADLSSITIVDSQQASGKYTIITNVADNAPITNTKTIVVIVTWENGRNSRVLTHIKSLAT